MKNNIKTLFISLFIILVSLQQTYAQTKFDDEQNSNKVSSLTIIQNGILKYSEISKTSFSEMNLDLVQGYLYISKSSNLGKTVHTSTYDISDFKFDKTLLKINFETSRKDITSIFANQSAKSCGSSLALVAMAQDMISQGTASGNTELVQYGQALLSMAMMLIAVECHVF